MILDIFCWVQGGPLPVTNEVKNQCKWPYKCVTEVITLLIGVIIAFISGRAPPCMDEHTKPHPI